MISLFSSRKVIVEMWDGDIRVLDAVKTQSGYVAKIDKISNGEWCLLLPQGGVICKGGVKVHGSPNMRLVKRWFPHSGWGKKDDGIEVNWGPFEVDITNQDYDTVSPDALFAYLSAVHQTCLKDNTHELEFQEVMEDAVEAFNDLNQTKYDPTQSFVDYTDRTKLRIPG